MHTTMQTDIQPHNQTDISIQANRCKPYNITDTSIQANRYKRLHTIIRCKIKSIKTSVEAVGNIYLILINLFEISVSVRNTVNQVMLMFNCLVHFIWSAYLQSYYIMKDDLLHTVLDRKSQSLCASSLTRHRSDCI